MVDANKLVREILDTVGGAKVTFYHPSVLNELPVISYYELAASTGLCYDNGERAQGASIAIDIWGAGGGECARIAVQVDQAMQGAGWRRELSRDLPPEDGIYHKAMRFYKQLYF